MAIRCNVIGTINLSKEVREAYVCRKTGRICTNQEIKQLQEAEEIRIRLVEEALISSGSKLPPIELKDLSIR